MPFRGGFVGSLCRVTAQNEVAIDIVNKYKDYRRFYFNFESVLQPQHALGKRKFFIIF